MHLLTAFVTFLLVFAVTSEITEEEGVLVLTNSNFDEALSAHEHILVEFYAPWCGHCKALAPEYAKAAQQLKEKGSSIKLAKVDATKETTLATKFEIQGYPTLKFFRNQAPIEYTGGRVADTIIAWLNKKTGPALTKLGTADEAETFINEQDVTLVGFFKSESSDKLKKLESAAMKIDHHPFGHVSDDSIIKHYDSKDEKLVLFKKFDEKRVDYDGDFSYESIKNFISANELPLVVEFNAESSSKVFGSDTKTHLLAFMGASADGHKERLDTLQSVAKNLRGKIHVVYINAEIEDHQRILEFFSLKKENIPAYRFINMADEMVKYKPDTEEFDAAKITDFVQKCLDGKVEPLLLSEEIPDDWDSKPVKVLVAKNFDSVARDRSKSVFVEFYAPWCGHCKALAPIWEELAEHYKDSKDVIVAKMDSTVNEVKGIKISGFPTIKFFPKDSDEMVDYDGDRTLEALKKFLTERGASADSKHDEL